MAFRVDLEPRNQDQNNNPAVRGKDQGKSLLKLLPPSLIISVVLAACQLKPVESQIPPDSSKPGITETAPSNPEISQVNLSVENYHLSQGYPADFASYVDVLGNLALKDNLKATDLDQVNHIRAETGEKTVEYAMMPFGIVNNLIDPDGQPALPKPVYYLASPDDQGSVQGSYAVGKLIETDQKGNVTFTSRMLDEATLRSWQNPENTQETKLGQLLYAIPLKEGVTVEQARQIQKDLIEGKLTPEQLMDQYTLGVSFLKPGSPETYVSLSLTENQESPTQEPDASLVKQLFQNLFGATPAYAMELSATATPPLVTPTTEPTPTTEIVQLTPEQQLVEYLKTDEAKIRIDQFVNSMKMAGIEVTGEQVSAGITYVDKKKDGTPLVDTDGNQYVVAVYNDPDPTKTGETLEGQIPLAIAQKNEKGEWECEKATPRFFADQKSIRFGVYVEPSEKRAVQSPLLKESFNQVVVPYYWHVLMSSEKSFNFSLSNYYLAVKDPKINFIGLHLVYQNPGTLPNWIKDGSLSEESYRTYLKKILQNSPNISIWTIGNEAYPTDFFAKKFGYPKYLEIAAEEARVANPKATLLYNDFGIESVGSAKYNQVKKLVDQLHNKGLVDGIGIQLHINSSKPPTKESLIKNFKSWGIPVFITELDVSTTDEKLKAQIFETVIEAALESGVCSNIDVWGFGSASWKSNANIFDSNFKPNASYFEIMSTFFEYF